MKLVVYGEPRPLPIHPRISLQLAQGTIKTIHDAIVELVTNSDDGYGGLEQNGHKVCGRIAIRAVRSQDGLCKLLEVRDFASGMSLEELKKSLVMGGETSEFYSGRKARGLFGRGLKETIIALGKGEVLTVKEAEFSAAQLWGNAKNRSSEFQISPNAQRASPQLRKELGIPNGNGTVVEIEVMNENIKCPSFRTLKRQIERHYALGDILQSDRRTVELTLEQQPSLGNRSRVLRETRTLRATPPEGKQVLPKKKITMHQYGDEIEVTICESDEGPLGCPKNNPFARAGIRIKTEGAILDNELFRFSYRQAAQYFFGEAICPGIAKRIRDGDFGLVDQNRAGIDWNHPYCKVLQAELEKLLEKLVLRKERDLNAAQRGKVSGGTQKKLRKVCALLNRLAKEELEEDLDADFDGILQTRDIKSLTIVPSVANVPPHRTRTLTVYAPRSIIEGHLPEPVVTVTSDNEMVPIILRDGSPVLEHQIVLRPHPKEGDSCYYGWFQVRGDLEDEEASIDCHLGEAKATASVRVAPAKTIGRRKRQRPPRKGGLFTDIKPNTQPKPQQRVFYDAKDGTIWIYVNFPGVREHLGEDLSMMEDPQGSILCSELVLEAFTYLMATKNFHRDRPPLPQSAEAAPYAVLGEINSLRAKYSKVVYDALVRH